MKLHQQANALESADLAQTALQAGRPAEALLYALEAVRGDPNSAATRILLARIQVDLQRGDAALITLDAASLYDQSNHHRLEIAALRAQAMLVAERDEDALPLLSELTNQCPDDAHLHRLAASACQRAGQLDVAIEHLKRVVALEPDDRTTARTLARLLAPQHPQMSIQFMQPTETAPAPADRWQATQWMRQAGRHRDAEENYRQMLATTADDPTLWIEAGEHAEAMGSLDLATSRLMNAIALPGPHQSHARSALAKAFMHGGRFAQAAWWWWKAVQCDRTDSAAWAGLTVCALNADRPHLVELSQRRLAALADEDEQMFAMAEAWMHASSGEVIRAATQPSQPAMPTASPLTWILQQSGDVLADHASKKACWADTYYHSAVCSAALGEHEIAREQVQAALDINPNYKAATSLAANLPKAA